MSHACQQFSLKYFREQLYTCENLAVCGALVTFANYVKMTSHNTFFSRSMKCFVAQEVNTNFMSGLVARFYRKYIVNNVAILHIYSSSDF